MSLMKQVQQLENDLFNALEAGHNYLNNRDYQKAKTCIATVEILNEEYKEITLVDFVAPKTILNFYERLWEMQNA